jgi:hypothetical protein
MEERVDSRVMMVTQQSGTKRLRGDILDGEDVAFPYAACVGKWRQRRQRGESGGGGGGQSNDVAACE